MKSHKIILFILVCLSFSIGSKAQTTMQTALNAGTRSATFEYSHTVNTGMLTTEYNRPGQTTNEVYYKLTLSVKMTLFIGHCGSEVTDTYVSLLNASGTQIAYNDNPAVNDRCTGKSLQAVLVAKDLAPGTYYIVSKGVSENGLISTRIEGDPQTTGNTMTAPFDLGTKSSAFSYTNTRNTHLFSNNYGRSTNEVFYKVTLGRKMGLSISHCGSEVSDTYLYVLNSSGTQIAYNDDPANDYMCDGNAYQSYLLLRDLAPGTYYIVSEGYSKNGYISTRIDGITGDTMNDAIDLGSKSAPFSYVDTRDTRMYTNSYGGQSSNDVFYKFTLTKQMPISISHCGSEVEDTYLYLLNASGNLIAYNDDPDEEICGDYSYNRAYLFTSLAAGTYHVVSKGYAENGPIRTVIEGYNITETGNTMANPIDAGTYSSEFTYKNRVNTGSFTNNYGASTNDVFHKFTITAPLTVIVDHCSYTTLDKTFVYLLNASGVRIATGSSSDSQYGDCPSYPYRGCLKVDNLPAGTYYVVSEGYSENGTVGTTIKGIKSYGGLAASGSQNYILTVIPTVETEDASTLPSDKTLQTVQYFDGLGRAMQTVQRGITPSKGDLIGMTEYDAFGREYKQWLPGAKSGNNGAFVPIDQAKSLSSSTNNNTVPYNEVVYEPSPLNRVIRQYGPGSEWRTGGDGKYVKTEYMTNNTSSPVLNCKKYRIDTSNNLICTDSYPDGQLFVTKTTDEDGKVSYEFKDKLGQVVLTRQGSENLDTYFVYDDFGDPVYVLSPAAVEAMGTGSGPWYAGSDAIRKYAYVYTYDKRRRCSVKQIPGTDPVYYVYDRADRPVMTQDGEQRKSKEWTIMLSDMYGRPAVSGIVRKDSTLAQLQASYENKYVAVRYTGNTSTYGYNNPYNLLQGIRYLNVSWYDHYKFLNLFPATEKSNLTSVANVYGTNKYSYKIGTEDYSAKGLSSPSGSITWMNDDENKKLYAAVYYDAKGRPVQTFASNHIGGFEKEYIVYSFTGKPVKKVQVHTAAGKPSITQTYKYSYDHADRLTKTLLSLDNETKEVPLSSRTYDNLGRLSGNGLHYSSSGKELEKYIMYLYNIRGWLTKIDSNSGQFTENIYYNTGVSDGFKSFSGNIGAVSWMSNYDPMRYYGFSYDGVNRMKKAQFTLNPADLGISGSQYPGTGAIAGDDIDVENYTEEILQYDRNGNIKRLKRDGLYKLETVLAGSTLNRKIKYGNIDDLTLSYNGNQLTKVTDASTNTVNVPTSFDFNQTKIANVNHYAYDANGRMTTDYNKSIYKTSYDYLNLPQRIYTLQGHSTAYSYDASGVKRRAAYRTNPNAPTSPVTTTTPVDTTNVTMVRNVTDYCGNIIYKDGTLSMILTPEGYVSKVDGKYVYHYFFKDHLGNVRAVVNGNGILEETDDYYPFGMPFAKKMNASVQPFKYSGKELEKMHGTNLYDFEARMKEVALPHFTTPDPLGEKRPWESLYVYCGNNPMNRIDPDGRDYYIMTSDGRTVLALKNDDNYDKLFSVQGETQKPGITKVLYQWGKVNGSTTVNDQSILPQLASNRSADVNYSISDNGSEALKVFKFAADHCNVEWGIEKFKENNKNRYFLGTLHETLKSPTVARAGRSMSSVVAGIHSHPNTRPDLRSELNSMGVDLGPYNEPYPLPFRNDYSLKTDPDGLYKYSLYYIYMQKSQNVWEIKNDGNLIKMNFNEIKF